MNTNAAMTYATVGTQALNPTPRLVLVDGGLAQDSPQSPRTYHEQATSSAPRVLTTAQGILAFCVALMMVVTVFSAGFARDVQIAQARDEALSGLPLEEVVVMPGDSLWQIAEAHPVEGVSTADVVSYISSSNNLPSANLQVGQHLFVPMG